jgi:hypothetical protein
MAQSEASADPEELIEDVSQDVYLRIQSDLVIIGDSLITDRHHGSGDNYEADDPQNKVGGIIPSFSLSGWLRHGMEAVVADAGGTACHPGESNANFMKDDVYNRDLEQGYHEKGACVDDPKSDAGCVVFDLFGGFGGIPGKFMRRPIQFSPVRSSVDYSRGQAEGHYRRVNRNVVSRNEEDNRTPLRNTGYDAVANLDGCWQLTFRELKPEFIGLLSAATAYLDRHQTDFMHQLGGARNFGAGIVDCSLINPLYTESEFRRLFDRGKRTTAAMDAKDDRWTSEYVPAFRDALDARIDG